MQNFAQKFYPKSWGNPHKLREQQKWHWRELERGYNISGTYRLGKLTFDDWHKDLPVTHGRRMIIGGRAPQALTIPLYTVSSYKGLEADGVILFLPNRNAADLETMAYVGTSRAKLALSIVAESSVLDAVPHLLGANRSSN